MARAAFVWLATGKKSISSYCIKEASINNNSTE